MFREFLSLLANLWLCWSPSTGQAEYLKYKDSKQPVATRVKDLLSRMTLEEKIGQMVLIDRRVANVEVMRTNFIGSVLNGGGSEPLPKATAEDWVNMINEFQKGALASRLGIPMMYGIDAVHGHNNVYNATIFPHNIGLGATSFVLEGKLICCASMSLKSIVRQLKEMRDGISNMSKRGAECRQWHS